MRIDEIGEFALIDLLRGNLPKDSRTLVGVGDDAAVYRMGNGKCLLTTCDMLVEEVHFSLRTASAYQIGWKSLASGLSDIAAMGGTALFAIVSIGLPGEAEVDLVKELYRGLVDLATNCEVSLLGGDTVRSPDRLVIDVFVAGECEEGGYVLRFGAQHGDAILVTGHLGSSSAGLELLASGETEGERTELVQAHLMPVPRLREALFLVENFCVNSMLDVSDGLAGDLGHICRQSVLGAKLWEDKIPSSDHLIRLCDALGKDPLNFALSGGEDYELLFTMTEEEAVRLEDCWNDHFEIPLSRIGFMDREASGIRLIDAEGRERPVEHAGYEHFTSA